jgi:hypothetical protein
MDPLAFPEPLRHAQQPWLFAHIVAAECLQGVAGNHSGEAILALDRTLGGKGFELVRREIPSRLHSIPGGLRRVSMVNDNSCIGHTVHAWTS